ncbi:MAG: gliding motility protein GldN, partial [Bacteroidota bacterium]
MRVPYLRLWLGSLLSSACVFASVYGQVNQPVDGLFATNQMLTRTALAEPPLREADLLYSKRIERLIDTREKINLPFRHPQKGFFLALEAGLQAGEVVLYNPAFPAFSQPYTAEEIREQLYRRDTITVTDPNTGCEYPQVVTNDFDPDRILRYKVKEITYFDRQTSTQRTRIIGMAPLVSQDTELGGQPLEVILGWIYWPHAREWFDRQPYHLDATSQPVISWGDIMAMRRFSSYITKADNTTDQPLKAKHKGRDLLIQSNKIARELSNREHDVWS